MKGKKKSSNPNNVDQVSDSGNKRKLIIGALAATGAFQLNTWRAQAHGNRSSHGSSEVLAFSPADFVIMREELSPFSAPDAAELRIVARELASPGFSAKPESERVGLESKKADLMQKLQVNPLTRQILDSIENNEIDAAVAIIEGVGSADKVLDAYNWTLLDIGRLGDEADHKVTTTKNLSQFNIVAQRALKYCEKLMGRMEENKALFQDALALQIKVAQIYHNIATFSVPDSGEIPEENLTRAVDTAEKALAMRQAMQQPLETMRAKTKLGYIYFRAGKIDQAKRILTVADQEANILGDRFDEAWCKYYLSEAFKQDDPQKAAAFRNESKTIATSIQKQQPFIAVLLHKLE